eukprot:753318-Hanusia_phi.AAC.2
MTILLECSRLRGQSGRIGAPDVLIVSIRRYESNRCELGSQGVIIPLSPERDQDAGSQMWHPRPDPSTTPIPPF